MILLYIILLNDKDKKIYLDNIIKSLNDSIGTNNNEKWDKINGDQSFICNTIENGSPQNNKLHPWTCEPNKRKWVSDCSTSNEIKNYANIATDIINLLKNANGTNINGRSYYDVINGLKDEYTEYLNSYLDALGFFGEVTRDIIEVLHVAIGDNDGAFDFLNGKFIQTNLKVILKYLKDSLGKDFYSVGLCLLIVGCSLILSISSTILLIVIINADVENNKKLAENTEIPNYPDSNAERVVGFKY